MMIDKTQAFKTKGIARRLTLYVVLASTFITIFTSGFQLYGIYETGVDGMSSRFEEIRDSHSANIASRVWVSNQHELEQEIRGIIRLPEIEYIEVYENSKLIVKEGKLPTTGIVQANYPLTYPFRGEDLKIGHLKIIGSMKNTYQKIIDQAWRIIFSNAIKTFLISGFMLLLFYQLVVRHLSEISEHAKHINADNLEHRLKLSRRKTDTNQKDEFDILVDAIHTMQDNIHSYVLKLIESEKKLKISENHLNRDITQRKETEKKLSLLLNSTGEGIYGIDLLGNCTFANEACIRILAFESVDELIGQNMHDLIHHHYQDGSFYPVEKCHIYQAFKEGKGTTVDDEVLWHKDGTSFPAEYRSFPVFEHGKAIGAVVSFINISERKVAEQKIFESEEKYRLAMEVTQDGLWDWDITTGEVYFSPGWRAILQVTSMDNDYSAWEHRIFADDKQKVLDTLKQHLAGQTEIWQEEHRLQKEDGSFIWVLGRGQVVSRDNEGQALRMIGTMTDIHAKKQDEEVIWHQANYDTLTLLPNRKLFMELLNKGIQRVKSEDEQLWLLFMDLDGFKDVNDTLGHQTGDELLIQVSERIQTCLRDTDIVARLGGDEFVVLLHRVRYINDIDQIATKIIKRIAEYFKLDKDIVHITTSVGIANFPNDADNGANLIKFADQSMYAAKEQGKNRYTYFTPALQQGSLLRIQLSTELRQAILDNQFELFYQPIIKLDDGDIYKAESLIRWNHPEKGFLNPGGFIQFAEETGIICDLGNWIFENAFKQLDRWEQQTDKKFQLSINMSPMQLTTREKKYQQWMDILNTCSFSGSSLVIEITEGLLIKDDPIVVNKLIKFRDAGIQVAIDDFGTGYSSLSYLKEFDIDYLKIDQSFIRSLKPGSVEESLSEAIIVMAHKLGLQVIAEGIETQGQLDLLTAMGCDYGQGYFFSKPVSAQEFEEKYIS